MTHTVDIGVEAVVVVTVVFFAACTQEVVQLLRLDFVHFLSLLVSACVVDLVVWLGSCMVLFA